MVLIWTDLPHVEPLQRSSRVTLPPGTPLPALLDETPFTQQNLCDLLKIGGFSNIKTQEVNAKIHIPDLRRWATLCWSFLGRLPGEEIWLRSRVSKLINAKIIKN